MRLALGRVSTTAATIAVVTVIAGCQGSGGDSVVAHVGANAITSSALVRQMAAMAPEGVVPDPPRYSACVAHGEALALGAVKAELREDCRQRYVVLKQQALARLISSYWLIGEAARPDVIALRRGAGGPGEAQPSAPTRTAADRDIAAQARAAEAKIRQALIQAEPRITVSEIAGYYRTHVARFEREERRYFDIVERYRTPQAARRAMRDGELRNLAAFAYHESLGRSKLLHTVAPRRAITKAVFAARPGALSGPVLVYGRYSVFRVTRVTPYARQPLSRAAHAIEALLVSQQRRKTLARFIQVWRGRWIARTDCRPGYVVQGCRQYRGRGNRESPYTFTV